MFCKNCGKEIEEDARFCPECGTAQRKTESFKTQEDDVADTKDTEEPAKAENSTQTNKEDVEEKQDDSIKLSSDKRKKTNPLCITSLILIILSDCFNFDYFGVVSYIAFIFAILGYRAVRKYGERGLILSVVCMAVAGISSFMKIAYLISYYTEYNRVFESAMDLLLQKRGNSQYDNLLPPFF